ncbi:hypothetical protein HMPREF3159_13890 [Brachybacterium sp. HMSC06H03]|uniref:hypothetical protein n=1 Tax=Brachybacterium sp. HMSC06H03 TaxID=1581127 RepID=UPI0008A4B29F|nr:hypothetical protein [Brachybacterium sp. HMSC06H03]OFT47545.1 hypothetical protein HMPREF3159_13890 [Brachybacterium sp. HMSC06H03]
MSSTPPSSPAPSHSSQGPDAPPVQDGKGASGSEIKNLSVPGLLAGGAAAATTSVIGGQLGISGTVFGAAITSVISAAVVAFYTDSVNGTARRLKQVKAKAGEKAQSRGRGGEVHSSRTRRHPGEDGAVGTAAAGVSGDRAGADGASGETPGRGRRIGRIALMSVVIALIGMAAVFGIQRLTGTELSPGTGEIQRSVTGTEHVTPREDSGGTTEDGTSEDGTGEDGTEQQDGTTMDPQQQDGTTEEGTTGDGTSEEGGGTSGDGSSSGGSSSSSGGEDDGGTSGSGTSGSGSSGSNSSGGSGSGSGASGSGSGSIGSES